MLKLDWAVVDKKKAELYPEFRKGLSYSEIENRLRAEGLDKEHIDFIIGELDEKLLVEKGKGDSTGIMILSTVSVLVFALVLGVIYRNGFILFSVGIGTAVFMWFKVVGKWLEERQSRK